MNEDVYAKLSKVAYEKDAPEVYEGYRLDKELSDGKRKTFVHEQTGDVVVANAGTQLKNPRQRMKDIGSDLAIAFGAEKYDPRFRESERHQRRVEHKYGGKGITQVGHSLGGSVANYLGKKSDSVKKVVTYNAGGGLFSDRGSGKSVNYYTQGDVLSNVRALVNRGTNIVTRGKRKNAHTIMNFV